jgi:hypothetical protein
LPPWAVFARVERRTASPLLAVGLLLRRPVAAGGFLMLIATGLLVGAFFLGSFSLQHAAGYSALRVGLLAGPYHPAKKQRLASRPGNGGPHGGDPMVALVEGHATRRGDRSRHL